MKIEGSELGELKDVMRDQNIDDAEEMKKIGSHEEEKKSHDLETSDYSVNVKRQ